MPMSSRGRCWLGRLFLPKLYLATLGQRDLERQLPSGRGVHRGCTRASHGRPSCPRFARQLRRINARRISIKSKTSGSQKVIITKPSFPVFTLLLSEGQSGFLGRSDFWLHFSGHSTGGGTFGPKHPISTLLDRSGPNPGKSLFSCHTTWIGRALPHSRIRV